MKSVVPICSALCLALTLSVPRPSLAEVTCHPIRAEAQGGGALPSSQKLKTEGQAHFSCRRDLVYDEQTIAADSYHVRDGEGLREIIKEVPDAVSHLNLYQENRRQVQKVAYLGTIGLVLAVLGATLLENSGAQKKFRTGAVYGGLALTGGSWIYGVAVMSNNEEHLRMAVENYNQAVPEKKIEMKFSTGLIF